MFGGMEAVLEMRAGMVGSARGRAVEERVGAAEVVWREGRGVVWVL